MFWARQRQAFPEKTAIWDTSGKATYAELSGLSDRVARGLLALGFSSGEPARVAFWIEPSIAYVAAQWGIWRSGHVAVPLCIQHPLPELSHALMESRASVLVHVGMPEALINELQAERPGVQVVPYSELLDQGSLTSSEAQPAGALPQVDDSWSSRPAQILFTSGTTGKPKGAIATHGNIEAGVRTLISAWGWGPRDHTLGVLPLHHTHGIINVLCTALAAGASLELFRDFEAATIWDRMVRPRDGARVTLFMAVPTVYSKLADTHALQGALTQLLWSDAAQKLRLFVSGSAALPVTMLDRWREITRHVLLERYGMTEIGMALSNPLVGARKAGFVGLPLPGVEVRLVDESGAEIRGHGVAGGIEVRGPSVFSGYFGREEATRQSFKPEGWFITGDHALRDEQGYYRILGRSSVDILKTGGYKVSALEIEEELRKHPQILEVSVVGVPDPEWGERVAAAYLVRPGETLAEQALVVWSKGRLARYKVPTLWREVAALPRNAMGKVLKSEVLRLFPVKSAPGHRSP